MKFNIISILLFLISQMALAVVDTRSANYADNWLHMKVPGSGFDLNFSGDYNSRTLFNGKTGFGWCTDFETLLEVTPENYIKLTECGGGSELTYTPKKINPKKVNDTIDMIMKKVKDEGQHLTAKYLKNLRKKLKENEYLRDGFIKKFNFKGAVKLGEIYYADGRKNENIKVTERFYVRTMADGTFQHFNKKGRLIYIHDRNKNFLKLNWKKDLLLSVVDNNGRKLNFKYNALNQKISHVTGPNGLKTEFKYEGDDLVWLKNAWGNIYKFKYKLHNMVRIDYPDKTYKLIGYDYDKDWVTSFRNRKGCVEKYDYKTNPKDPIRHYWSTVIKKCGKVVTNRSKYEFFHRDHRNGIGHYLHRMKSVVNNDVLDITYHEVFGKPISIIEHNRKTSFTYYPSGLVKKKIESKQATLFSYNKKCQKVSDLNTIYFDWKIIKNKKGQKVKKKTILKTVKSKFKYDPNRCNLRYASNSEGQTAKVSYDTRGRISRIKDQSKKIVLIKYEEKFGKPHVVTRPGLGSITVFYKNDGEISDVKSKQGPIVAVQVASIFNTLLDIIAPATVESNI